MTQEADRGVLVAFDTSGDVASVAVGRDGAVLATRTLAERSTHARQLLPTLAAALDESGFGRDRIVGVVVGAGPGSFTGVRVAAATAKALCHALHVPLFPVSSLQAAAWGMGPEHHTDALRTVVFDARADRVFTAAYRWVGAVGKEVRAPHATTVDLVIADRAGEPGLAMGSGARKHAALFIAAGWPVLEPPWGEATAEALLNLHWSRTATDPDGAGLSPTAASSWRPLYLKGSSATRPPRPPTLAGSHERAPHDDA